jgi:hypothetical protein
MARLTDAVKLFIVQQLACFDSPQKVADAVREEFGITIRRQRVEDYDPLKRPRLAKKWRELHAFTRTRFLFEVTKEPAYHRAVRVRRLAQMAELAQQRRSIPLAASLYEQIAKETEGWFSNRRIVMPTDPRGPLGELARLLGYTTEQLTEEMAKIEQESAEQESAERSARPFDRGVITGGPDA